MNHPFLYATVRESSSAEIQALDEICEQIGGFDERVNLEWVDGFLTALAATPAALSPEVWLPAMLGDSFERVYADPDDHVRALRVLQTRLKVLSEQLNPEALLDAPEKIRLAPLMMRWDDETRAQALAAMPQVLPEQPASTSAELMQLQTGNDWALGFLECTDALSEYWQADWPAEAAELREQLQMHIEVLLMEEGSADRAETLQQLYGSPDEAAPSGDHSAADAAKPAAAVAAEPDREDLIADALAAVQELRVLLLDQAPRAATRRVQAQPGRNDPCHCGSGKKFKKCHGA